MGKTICIISQKGGTGKTTTAINLAAALSLFEKKTLLIDCDPQGNATTGLGINKNTLQWDLYHGLIGQAKFKDIIVDGPLETLKVLPTKFHLYNAEFRLKRKRKKERILRKFISKAVSDYDFILIDSPGSLGFLAISAMVAADWLLIPTQFQLFAFEGLGQMLSIVRQIRKKYNTSLKVLGILMTMCDDSGNLSGSFPASALNELQSKFFKTSIPMDNLLRESSDFAKPIVLHEIMSNGAKSYMDLATEIINHFSLINIDQN